MEIFKLLMHPDVISLSIVLEMSGTVTFMCRGAVNIIIGKLKELNPPEGRALQQAALQRNPAGHPTEFVGLPTKQGLPLKEKLARYGVMYKPAVGNFPLVDAFFFMESPRKTLVGLQMTTANARHIQTSTVRLFKERMADYFNGWEELSRDLSWEIIYVQHADSTPISDWQKCNDSANLTEAENREIAAFWEEKVHQYQVSITAEM
ncbi:retrotransposon hot spot (RHS) protein, putative [Trypanosoma cruzi]|nr:retrotransposon hot spot (RHS) protein, putative [Trypanosoma cruzi]